MTCFAVNSDVISNSPHLSQPAEAKEYITQAFEGRKNLFVEDAKETMDSLCNLGAIYGDCSRDCDTALDCYEKCRRVQEKKWVCTHPLAQTTVKNMALAYMNGKHDYRKAEILLRRALDRFERTRGKVSVRELLRTSVHLHLIIRTCRVTSYSPRSS